MSWIDEAEATYWRHGDVMPREWYKLIAAARWAEAQVAWIDWDVDPLTDDARDLARGCEAAEAAYRAVRDK